MSELSADVSVDDNRILGPHIVPYIECGKCGTENHYDATIGDYIGHCRECNGYLRRPTDAEHKQMTEFIVWKHKHMERER